MYIWIIGDKGDMGRPGIRGVYHIKSFSQKLDVPIKTGLLLDYSWFLGLVGLKGDIGIPGEPGIAGEVIEIKGAKGERGEAGLVGLPGTVGLKGNN